MSAQRQVVRPRRSEGGSPAAVGGADVTRLPSYQEGYRDGHDAGYRDGHALGVAEGREQGAAQAALEERERAQVRAQVDASERLTRDQRYEAVARTLDERIDAALVELATRLEVSGHQVVHLGVELAVALAGRELALADEPARAALERALALAPDSPTVVARMHPSDVALADWDRPGLEVVADHTVEPGGCIVEAGDTTVDAQLSGAVERLRAVVAELSPRSEHP